MRNIKKRSIYSAIGPDVHKTSFGYRVVYYLDTVESLVQKYKYLE